MRTHIIIGILGVFCLAACQKVPSGTRQGMVTSPHPLASQVGVDVMRAGGNAVDAAVATGLALGVVDQFNSGLGGGMFMIIRMNDGRTTVIDGRETAPAAAHAKMYFKNGAYVAGSSRDGVLAAGTPGALAGYAKALELFGTKSLAQVINPSVKIAREGFTIDPYYSTRLASVAETLRKDPNNRFYFRADGSPFQTGDTLRQPLLAKTYQNIGTHGIDFFYRGPVALALHKFMAAQGGIMTQNDLAQYQPALREAIHGKYRGYDIISMPPPSSGGIHIAQMLGVLERLGEPVTAEQLVRTMSYAYRDRHQHLGDTDFVTVPVQKLLAPQYLDGIANRIKNRLAPQTPTETSRTDLLSRHTAGFVVFDQYGNSVAATATLNTTFGAKVSIPGTGIMLNNQMDDFVTNPGKANAYGLTGTEQNWVAPGKRPLSSMSPTIVVENGQAIMAVAAAGGSMIITSVLQTLRNVLLYTLPVADAVAAPRLHHQWQPANVMTEAETGVWIRAQLISAGWDVVRPPWHAKVQAIVRNLRTGLITGASDPRAGGAAVGY